MRSGILYYGMFTGNRLRGKQLDTDRRSGACPYRIFRNGHLHDLYRIRRRGRTGACITEEGKNGDALSTSMFVKGLDQAQDYWREHQDFDMILLTEDGEIWITENAESRFTLSDSFANMEMHVITPD